MKQKDTRYQNNCHGRLQKTLAVPAPAEIPEGKRSLPPLSGTMSLSRAERDGIALDSVISPLKKSALRWPSEPAGMITRPHAINQRPQLPLRGQLR